MFHVKRDPVAPLLELIATAQQRLVADRSPAALAAHAADARSSLDLLVGESGSLIDVGSGAGFPGIPILLERPDLAGMLLDSRARRCAHLATAVAACGLAGRVEVLNQRAEEHAAGPGREVYGVAVARALAPPPVAIELCLPLLRTGGLLVLHAGAVDRVQAEEAAFALGGAVETLRRVPGFERRNQLAVRKTGPTPPGFPRKVGAAARDPFVRGAD